MAPRLFKEYRWYNLRQASDPSHLMKELTGLVLDGLVPSTEEYVPVESDQGVDGIGVDWASTPFRGSFSRSNSPSPSGTPRDDGLACGSGHSHPDEGNTNQGPWEDDSLTHRMLQKIGTMDMDDVITQGTQQDDRQSSPFSAPKGGAPSTPKRTLEFTAPRNKALRTGQGSLPSTPRTSTQSSTEQSTGEWETATEERAEQRRLLTSPGLWGLN